MQVQWKVDDANSVVLNLGVFGSKLLINGSARPVKINPNRMNHVPLTLADGRDAALTVTPRIATRPGFALAVGDEQILETPRNPILCGACGKAVGPGERLCACGQALPPPEYYRHQSNIRAAVRLIGGLSLLYLAIGVVYFLISIPQHNLELADVAGMAPNAVVPHASGGVSYTVAEYRERIAWESRGVLLVCLGISAFMGLLAWWGRRTPLPALSIVAAIYVLVAVLNMLFSGADKEHPNTLIVYQVLVCIYLLRGVKSALALREGVVAA